MHTDRKLSDSLKATPWFLDLNSRQIERIENITIQKDVNPSEIIFLEGDKEDYIYILVSGQITIEMTIPGHEPISMHVAQPGEIVGWSSVTPVIRRRTATARATRSSQLLAIDSIKLREICDDDHDMGYFLMRHLANVVATRLLLTRLQLVEMITNNPILN